MFMPALPVPHPVMCLHTLKLQALSFCAQHIFLCYGQIGMCLTLCKVGYKY